MTINKTYPELLSCEVCPRLCGVNRYNQKGFCSASDQVEINLFQLHFGEEPVLSGTRGSGTIFFSHCNLKCVFCQNYEISADGWGKVISIGELSAAMLSLQAQGAHNINLVTPTHYTVQIIDALKIARRDGLSIPIVWNSNGYEKVETLKLLEGLVDVYLPDFKFYYGKHAQRYTSAPDYPAIAKQAITEMYRQTGDLIINPDGIAQKGLIIRLLVMPGRVAGTSDVLHWIHDNLGNRVYVSIMAQYYPTYKAENYCEINRGITEREYDEVISVMNNLGFVNGFVQELSCSSEWTPDFVQEVI